MDSSIFLIYGTDPKEMTGKLLSRTSLADCIHPNAKIGIKPNLVNATPPENGATTHAGVVEGIVEYLQDSGQEDITILEGSWVGGSTKEAFRRLGYEELAKTHHVRLLDTKTDRFESRTADGIEIEVSRTALELDYLIDVPVLKGHCQTLVTGALKNMKGIISDREKRRFHSMGLHRPIAALNAIIRADFCIVDGICGDLDFEDGGNPVQMNRIFCCDDPVLADSFIARTMGYDPMEIEYIALAERLGVGSSDIEGAKIIELNRDDSKVGPSPSRIVRELSEFVDGRDACSACFANLMQALMRLKDSGELKKFAPKGIAVGQGWRGQSMPLKGVGNCTCRFSSHVKGCPPDTKDMLHYLRSTL